MIVNQELKLIINKRVTRMDSYRGLISGRADNISFKGAYILGERRILAPDPNPEIHNTGAKKVFT